MNAFITAVVISHDAADFFAATLGAVQDQTRRPDRIVVVDTSHNEILIDAQQNPGVELIRAEPNTGLQQAIKLALGDATTDWLWLLHDDSAPAPDALEKLLAQIEISPSVAIAGPKLVQWNNPRMIAQMGLTLTPFGAPFSSIRGQFDQGQLDDVDDVMAVGTAAVLYRTDVFAELGGFDPAAPPLAADIDYSIRARLAGHRVIVAPQARVRHAELSLNGKRERRWLRTSSKAAIRRSAIHLRLAYSPLALALLFWLFLPAIGLLRAFWRVASKRPELIWVEFASGIWGFFTVFKRLSSRRNIKRTRKLKLRELKPLRATWPQVRSHHRAQAERDELRDNLQAFDRGEIDKLSGVTTAGFVGTGGLWWVLGLIAVSYQWWPRDIAATVGGTIPLSAKWFSVFTHAGASYQNIGLGFFAPSDPFAWVLTALGGLTFWAPSLSVAILLLLVKPLAFMGAWRLAAQVTQQTWLRVLAGLSFAFCPALATAQSDGRLPAIVASLLLPWFVLGLIRAAQIGRITRSSSQSWTWVALSGLSLAAIGASAPNLLPILILSLAFVALIRWRRIGYLVWIVLPLATIFGPTVIYYVVGLAHPLALLADPGLAQASAAAPFLPLPALIASAPIVLFASFALLRKRAGLSVAIWLTALLLLSGAYLIAEINFPAVGVGQANLDTVNGSPAALLSAAGLALSVLFAIALDGIPARNARRVIASLATVLVVLPSVALAVLSSPTPKFTDGRVVPSIVAAEAEQGSTLKLLELTPSVDSAGNKRIAAELVGGDGVHLDDVSLGYRFAIAGLSQAKYREAAQMVADLASGNGASLTERLQQNHIGYVLLPLGSTADFANLGIALDSAPELESVGTTDFGRLWRVREPKQIQDAATSSPWSITKGVQVAILVGFILMAVPGRSPRRKGEESIFIEAGEEAQ
jgi:GT2 family glycosyltransferase